MKKSLKLSDGDAIALIAAAVALIGSQLGDTWYGLVITLASVGAIFAFLLVRWPRANLSPRSRAVGLVAGCGLLIAAGFQPVTDRIRRAYFPDDLIATVKFKDQNQIGAKAIEFAFAVNNRGSRPVTVQDIGAVLISGDADFVRENSVRGDDIPACDLSKFNPQFLDTWYARPGPNRGNYLGKASKLTYFLQRSSLDQNFGVSIEGGREKSVNGSVEGIDPTKFGDDTVAVCPIIRYVDFDSAERVVICGGMAVSRGAGGEIKYFLADPRAFRLLPHLAGNVECKRIGPPEHWPPK